MASLGFFWPEMFNSTTQIKRALNTKRRRTVRPRTPSFEALEERTLLASFSINDVSVTEGNSGTTLATFTVSLSSGSPQTVTVQYSTADGTATAPGDYTTKTGTLTFSPGVVTQTLSITVNGDTASEPNESFYVNLSNPVAATIADGQGVGTIVNDDSASPTLSVNDLASVRATPALRMPHSWSAFRRRAAKR
jgi:hypothetical protein